MLASRSTVAFLLLTCCSRVDSREGQNAAGPPALAPATTTTAVGQDAAATRTKARCLPVVSTVCGCTYSCGVGAPRGDGVYDVEHPGWKPLLLSAQLTTWCAEGRCTEAFDAQLICSGVCTRKPADSTCHFDAEKRCIGGG